jgi:c-di-GMP-binding flagellar brake protein YcgR
MFERTFSFWRRLVGRQEAPDQAGGTAVEEDRRLWVRYQANGLAQVHLSQQDRAERISARVHDISLGGANLIADRPFEPGQILSVELPSGASGEQQVVLACIVRVVPQSSHEWSLGCVFSRELSVEDLHKVGAGKAKAGEDDQRTWVRYDCSLTATYQRIGEEGGPSHTAQVLNVSASGVGLLLSEPAESGSLFSLSLHGERGQAVRSILACVVHTTARSTGELAAGCNFIRELSEAELQALV